VLDSRRRQSTYSRQRDVPALGHVFLRGDNAHAARDGYKTAGRGSFPHHSLVETHVDIFKVILAAGMVGDRSIQVLREC